MEPRTIAIIQARMSSSRLPGKVLLDIAGEPMLARVVERAQRAKFVDKVIVATTTDPSDDPVGEFCTEHGYDFTRGSLHDVLDRYYQSARQFDADVIVRLTADCPVLDPEVVDQTIAVIANPEGVKQSQTVCHSHENGNPILDPRFRGDDVGLKV